MSREMIEPWRQYGVKLEKEEMVDGVLHLFISVPTVSDFIDDNGNELSGALLAKRVKRSISDPIVLKSRTRNERWTKNMSYNIDCKPKENTKSNYQGANRNNYTDLFDLFFGQGRGNPFV